MKSPFLFVMVSCLLFFVVARLFFMFILNYWFIALPLVGYLGYKVYKLKKMFTTLKFNRNGEKEAGLDPCKQVKGGSFKVVK